MKMVIWYLPNCTINCAAIVAIAAANIVLTGLRNRKSII
jgi:hypothetical protein